MAVTVTPVPAFGYTLSKVFTVTATADADTTAVITHGFGATGNPNGITDAATAGARLRINLTPLNADFHLSLWTVAFTDANTITLTKGTASGSGGTDPQVRVEVALPHSMVA